MTAHDLINKYGPPNKAYLNTHCYVWHVQDDFPWFPAKIIYINREFKDVLYVSFLAVQTAGLQGEIKTYNGCYVDRPVRGSNSISAHAYACAIDLDAADEGMVVNPTEEQRQGKWTRGFISAMKSSGIYYGGDFKHRADPMHWAYANM